MLHAWKYRFVAATAVAAVAVSTLILAHGRGSSAEAALPELIQLPAKEAFSYRQNGEFTQAGRPVAAPMVSAAVPHPLAIMKRQVTAAEYSRCVDASACPRNQREERAADRPVVKVNWYDAEAYAAWLSRETGQHFRLPTDEEWNYAAANRVTDESLTQGNPGQRAVASYEFEANLTGDLDREPRPIGSFGANDNGLLDLAGNVWEWTDTCFNRHALDGDGQSVSATAYCGIRIAEGRHRAYMLDFVRDSRIGGCSVGTPPTNLGFRLVREDDDPWHGLWSLMTWAEHRLGLGA
jgi:formylglycine-generating enzyme required for sulfatase activity